MINNAKSLISRFPSLSNALATLSVSALFMTSVHAAAQPLPGVTIPSGSGGVNTFLNDVICQVAVWMFWILIALSVVYVLWAAYKYLTSAGEEEKIRSANRTIVYAAVAVAVALIAKGFPIVIVGIFPSVANFNNGTNTCP